MHALVLSSLQATFVVPSVASLQSINNVWGGNRSILDAGVLYNFTLSFLWQLPPIAESITQIRVSTKEANISSFDPLFISAYLNRFVFTVTFTFTSNTTSSLQPTVLPFYFFNF
jgi:hypothetical protein